jgi:hypothetical protein
VILLLSSVTVAQLALNQKDTVRFGGEQPRRQSAESFPSLFACRRISMPIESNEAEDNEEREGDFYSHVHTWSFLLVQPIVAWKVLANKRHLEPTLRFELRDPQFKDPQF